MTIFLGICLQESSCQYYPPSGETDNNEEGGFDLASSISTVLVETISKKIRTLFEIFDVKVRFIKFLRSLYTPDNIELVRRSLDLAVRFGSWILQILPSGDSPASSILINLLFPPDLGDNNNNLPDKYGPPLPDQKPGDSFTSAKPPSSSYGPPVVQILRASRSLNEEDRHIVEENVAQIKNLEKLLNAGEDNRK